MPVVEISGLIGQLGSDDGATRRAALDGLVAIGAGAVAPVLETMSDEDSPVDWGICSTALKRIGHPAFTPLTEAIASAPTPERKRRACFTFAGLEVSDKAIYVPALRHASPDVRAQAAYVLQLMKDGAAPFADALAELLGDPDSDVRQRVIWAFASIGPDAIPVLRRARRRPGGHRRTALTALAETGGWDALERRDQDLVGRLIKIKSQAEVPQPMHLCGYWYALPTTDQAAVLEAFGLADPHPVTMQLGESAWNYDHHNWSGRADHIKCARSYVSPGLDGWTLVFGELPEISHFRPGDGSDSLPGARMQACRDLSVRFGAAHCYGASCGDAWTAWCLAEDGRVTRYYDVFEPEEQVGPRHPAESGYLLPHEDGFPDGAFDGIDPSDSHAFRRRYIAVRQQLCIPDEAHATTVAARASVDPAALGPHTTVIGHAVIAATTCRQYQPSPPGALTI
jgi:hypothetical protein